MFDGGYLPAKAEKEVERKTKREANMQRARQLLREGNISGAHQFFSKAADVTPFMAHQLIQVPSQRRLHVHARQHDTIGKLRREKQ